MGELKKRVEAITHFTEKSNQRNTASEIVQEQLLKIINAAQLTKNAYIENCACYALENFYKIIKKF